MMGAGGLRVACRFGRGDRLLFSRPYFSLSGSFVEPKAREFGPRLRREVRRIVEWLVVALSLWVWAV